MRKLITLVLVLSCFSVFAESLTLNQALKKALDNNPKIKALRLNLKASTYGEKASKKVKYGELDLNAGFKKTSDENVIRPMSKDLILAGLTNMPFDNEYWYWSLDYNLPVYWGGKIKASEQMAKEKKNSVYYKLKSLEWSLRYDTVKVYLGLLSANSQIESLDSYLKSLESLKKHIEDGFKLGKFAEVDLYKVNFQIEDAKYKIETLKQVKTSLLNALGNLIGEEDLSGYTFIDTINEEPSLNLPDLKSLIAQAYKERSDFMDAKAYVKIKKLNVTMAKADWKPKVNLNANLMAVNGNNIDYSDRFWTITANVSFPLFDMGRRHKKIKQAKKEEESAVNLLEGTKLNIKKEVVDAYSKIRKEYQNYKTAAASLKLQTEVERIEQLKYDNGMGDIDDLLMAKARRQLAEANVIKAKYNYFIAKEELKKSIEGELK